MAKTLVQRVTFKNADPRTVYRLYADAAQHAAITQSRVRMGKKPGTGWSAFDGWCGGKMLALAHGRLVAQTWRAHDWPARHPDSLLVLTFLPAKDGTELTMVHAGVPDAQAKALDRGWRDHYWTPWKAHLARAR